MIMFNAPMPDGELVQYKPETGFVYDTTPVWLRAPATVNFKGESNAPNGLDSDQLATSSFNSLSDGIR